LPPTTSPVLPAETTANPANESAEEVVAIAEKAIEHVGKFASRFGFELAPKKPALNADLEKTVTVKVNTKIARQMLDLAGFYSAYEKSDDEVFEMVMNMMSCYGATYKISFDDA
jgi:hypothetical protein